MGRRKQKERMKVLSITVTNDQYNFLMEKENASKYIRDLLSNKNSDAKIQRIEAEKRELMALNMELQQKLHTLVKMLEEGKFKVYTDKLTSSELKFLEEL